MDRIERPFFPIIYVRGYAMTRAEIVETTSTPYMGLEWGGSWKTIVDQPHFQLRPAWAMDLSERDMLAEMRTRQAAGGPVFA